MHRIDFATTRHIAIIRRNGLGDLLCTMPLLTYCRRMAPQAKITLIVEQRNAPLVPFLRGYDAVAVLPTGNKYLSALVNGFRHWFHGVDVAISAKPTPMKLMNFSLWALRAKQRIAVVDEAWHSRLVNCPVHPSETPQGIIHQALAALRLVAPNMAEVPADLYPTLTLPSAVPQPSYGEAGVPLIFTSVTSTKENNTLGVEGYGTILNTLAKQRLFHVVISCEQRDQAKAQALSAKLSMPNLVVPTRSIGELLSVVNASDVALVGDGGVMHIAAALKKRVIGLFGRRTERQWHPLSDSAIWHADAEHVANIPHELILQSLHQQLDALTIPKATCAPKVH